MHRILKQKKEKNKKIQKTKTKTKIIKQKKMQKTKHKTKKGNPLYTLQLQKHVEIKSKFSENDRPSDRLFHYFT